MNLLQNQDDHDWSASMSHNNKDIATNLNLFYYNNSMSFEWESMFMQIFIAIFVL